MAETAALELERELPSLHRHLALRLPNEGVGGEEEGVGGLHRLGDASAEGVDHGVDSVAVDLIARLAGVVDRDQGDRSGRSGHEREPLEVDALVLEAVA